MTKVSSDIFAALLTCGREFTLSAHSVQIPPEVLQMFEDCRCQWYGSSDDRLTLDRVGYRLLLSASLVVKVDDLCREPDDVVILENGRCIEGIHYE